MSTKSILLSAAALLSAASLASAQSLLDLPGLFGRQQTRPQENSVTVEYDVDFQYFFDMREFGASKDIFMGSGTINAARFSPSAAVRFDSGRGMIHRAAIGVDLTKDLGANPTSEAIYSEDENDQQLRNFKLIKDIFFYYSFEGRAGKGDIGFHAGIFPKSMLFGDYTRAIFADELRYYDPNLEGITVQYRAPRFQAELTADLFSKYGLDRVGGEMIFTAGVFKPLDWASLGWSAAYTHSKGSFLQIADVDYLLAYPYAKADFGSLVGMQELSVKAGPMISYQLDYAVVKTDESGQEVNEEPHFPFGAEVMLTARHWGLGIENTFYYGDNMQVYRNNTYSDISAAAAYASVIYGGEEFYFTRRNCPAYYDRLELYWQPLDYGFVKAKLSAVSHFVTPALSGEDTIGPFIGMQAKAALFFNLDAFRHPRQSAARSSRGSRSRSSDGPVLSL